MTAFLAALLASQSGSAGDAVTERVSTAADGVTLVVIDTIFIDPAQFENRHVRLSGMVAEQDPDGHWLYLEDQTDRIYIATPFAIPALEGRSVTITGVRDDVSSARLAM